MTEIKRDVKCYQNKRIHLYAIQYEPGMEDGFDQACWQKIQMTPRGRIVHYAKPLPNQWNAPHPGFTKVKKDIPYIITDNGKEYLDPDYYIVNPHKNTARFVVHKFKFLDAYEIAELGEDGLSENDVLLRHYKEMLEHVMVQAGEAGCQILLPLSRHGISGNDSIVDDIETGRINDDLIQLNYQAYHKQKNQ